MTPWTMHTSRPRTPTGAARVGGWRRAAGAALASAVLGLAGTAHAADVYWSVGVHQPGVSVRVGNTPPVVLAPAPTVVVAPPARVVMAPPVMLAPPAVVVAPVYGYAVPPGHLKPKHHHRHRHYHGWPEHRVQWEGGGYRHDGGRGWR